MSTNVSYETWIERFREEHADRYEYGDILPRESGQNRKIEIFCKEHGLFLRYLGKHWRNTTVTGRKGGGGCPKCLTPFKGRQDYSVADWLDEFKDNQPIPYNYDKIEFLDKGSKVRVNCSNHGWFTQQKTAHASGTVGCAGCWVELRGRDFIAKAEKLFPDRYDYSSFEYTDSRVESKVICKEHGDFFIAPNRMLCGKHPCPSCYKVARSELHPGGVGGYSKKVFERDPELANAPSQVYYIKIGGYYKVGISTKLHKRLTALKSKSKMEIEILDEYSCSLYDAYRLEQYILLSNSKNRVRTTWSAELFDIDVLNGVSLASVIPDPTTLKHIP